MCLNYVIMVSIRVKSILIFFIAFDFRIVLGIDTTTVEALPQTTDSNLISSTTTPILTTIEFLTSQTTSSIVNLTSTVLPPVSDTKQKLILKTPSITVPLVGNNLMLNISSQENSVEFTVILKTALEEKGSDLFGIPISQAKRLLIALENEHFNVDIIAMTLINDTDGKVAFGNQIEDLTWNKGNGVLLPDTTQNYKWIASGAEKNGSQFFATFTRTWATCDNQDIQFSLNPLKIWWFLETQENLPTLFSKGKIRKDSMRKEKLRAKRQVDTQPEIDISSNPPDLPTTTIPLASTSSDDTSTPIATITTVVSPTEVTLNTTTGVGLTSMNDTEIDSNRTVPLRPGAEEVEILKSIEEYNFKGPVNVSMVHLLQNVTSIILKACDDSSPLFRCSASDYKDFENFNSTQGLFVWKITGIGYSWNSTVKLPEEYQTESCQSARSYSFTSGNIANKKLYNALSGNRIPKSHIKNQSKNMGRMNKCTNTILFINLSIFVILRLTFQKLCIIQSVTL